MVQGGLLAPVAETFKTAPRFGIFIFGTGLSIVKSAVERMGGAIGVESKPGVGSKFWIELPMAAEI